tara:strand:+ start:775 stop:951 length:177 start_codon:yes stop_codon:yes gene_type:complete
MIEFFLAFFFIMMAISLILKYPLEDGNYTDDQLESGVKIFLWTFYIIVFTLLTILFFG